MSGKKEFSNYRFILDKEITYGTNRRAKKIATQALTDAQKQNLPGEIEYFKGQIELLNGRFAHAIEHFDSAIKFNPKDGASYNDRALCMVELGIIDEAFFYFNKGIAVEPDYATIYHNKGWLLNNIGRHTEAIRCFKKALSLEPDRAVTYDNLADAFLNLSDFRSAKEAYQKVLDLLDPGCCMQIRRQVSKQIKTIDKNLKKKK